MTAPRQILAGKTHLVTRRCSEQRYFLRPDALTSGVFLYVLAIAAERYGIDVHAFCVMSNHYHLVVTDPLATLPAFLQYLDGLVARAMNAAIGHREGFWSSEASYNTVELATPADVVAKVAYVLANPVASRLVPRGSEWPGLRTAPGQMGAARLSASRPEVFFRKDGDMPAAAELVLTAPPGFASAEDFRAQVTEATEALEAEHRRAAKASRRSFLGRARVLAMSRFARPAPAERRPGRKIIPRVAARDEAIRIARLEALALFLAEYREARDALVAGVRDVVFPAGTYLLRVQLGVRCAAAPA